MTRLDSNEDVNESTMRVTFQDRLGELRGLFRLAACTFPVQGVYQFTLLVDDEWITHRLVRVLPAETVP